MAASSVEPLAVFTDLTAKLPQWITELSALSDHAAKKNADFITEYSTALSHAKPKRLRSRSLRSLHTNDEESTDVAPNDLSIPDQSPAPPDPVEISPFEPGNKYLYAQARRKRKPGTSIRSGASGPQTFRSKQMVIIYYDSYLQTELDGMVKKFGAVRNELRKAKMTNAAKRGFQLPKLPRKHNDMVLPSARDTSKGLKLSSDKPMSASPTLNNEEEVEGVTASTFINVDRDLEAAQSLCETAAHQFLRDGDCRTELDAAPKRLEAVLALATTAKQQLEVEKARSTEPRPEIPSESTSSDSQATLYTDNWRGVFTNKMAPPPLSEKFSPAAHQPIGMDTTEIEVDDASDASTLEIDIKNFRMARAGGIRT